MNDQTLTDRQKQEIDEQIELGLRRYFDHYLNEVLPRTIEVAFHIHDHDCEAHGRVVKRFERFKWLLIGLAAGGGAGAGAGLVKLLGSFL